MVMTSLKVITELQFIILFYKRSVWNINQTRFFYCSQINIVFKIVNTSSKTIFEIKTIIQRFLLLVNTSICYLLLLRLRWADFEAGALVEGHCRLAAGRLGTSCSAARRHAAWCKKDTVGVRWRQRAGARHASLVDAEAERSGDGQRTRTRFEAHTPRGHCP